MIPITYRLDSAAEKEYVDKVVPCMEHPETYSKKLESLLYSMGAIGWDILTRAKRFQFDYPKIYCLCQWIVMPYDEMEEIRKYLEGIISLLPHQYVYWLVSSESESAEQRRFHFSPNR